MGNDKRTLADADSANDIEHAPTRVLWETVEMLQDKGQGLEDAASQNVLIDELDERGVSLSVESTRVAAQAADRVSDHLLAGTRLGAAWDRARAELGLPKEARMAAETMMILSERHPSFLRTKRMDGSTQTRAAALSPDARALLHAIKIDVDNALDKMREVVGRSPVPFDSKLWTDWVVDLMDLSSELQSALTTMAARHSSFLRPKRMPVNGATHTAGASEEYATKWSEVMAKVDRVQAALAAHREEQLRAPTDYGYVGDLGNVGEYLDNILTFLKG